MIDFKKLENICASVIVVAFFLPWADLGFASVSGYSLPNLVNSMAQLGQAFSDNSEASTNYSIYIVYLVPLLGILILLFGYLNKPIKNICLAACALNLGGFIYHLIAESGGEIGMYGIGIWITLLASIVMLLSTLGYIKRDLPT
jgi:hypothetical protein